MGSKSICLYFQVHQPDRLRQFRFFDIGNNDIYFDEFANKTILRRIADRCYLPANAIISDLIKKNGKKFKVAYSISGVFLEQAAQYAPEVIESFKELAKSGCVEFLAETYAHTLASLADTAEFKSQVKLHAKTIENLFGVKPVTFRNTELIYSDKIGADVADMGFSTMITDGAKHILGWKSPNYIYTNSINPKLKLLLKNAALSDDIAFRFSDRSWAGWPLDAQKFASWVAKALEKDDTVNLFMDYETFGEHQRRETGIFDFLAALPDAMKAYPEITFRMPSEVAKAHQPVAPMHVPFPISWADEERDTSAWLGNELQNEAYNKLYGLSKLVNKLKDNDILSTYRKLQESDHFYYMCTKFFSDGAVHSYFNPYDTPYEAFINYMNVLSDFELKITEALKITKKKKKQ